MRVVGACAVVNVVLVAWCCYGVLGGSLSQPDDEEPIVQTSAEVKELKDKITQEQIRSQELGSQVSQLTDTITVLRSRLDHINRTADTVSKQVQAVVSATKPPTTPAPTGDYVVSNHQTAVAYEGIMTSDLDNAHKGDNLIFNEAITDVGTAYNRGTGVFTCPVRGVYLFALTLMVDVEKNHAGTVIKVAIRKNGAEKPLAEPTTYTAAGIVGTGEVSVTEADVGDEITVTQDSDEESVYIKRFTRFTAVLIQELKTVH